MWNQAGDLSLCWVMPNQLSYTGQGDCLFILSIVSFAMQKLFSLIQSHLLIFASVACAFGVISKKFLLKLMSEIFFLMFSSRSCMALGLLFKFLIHFKLILLSGVK